MATETCNISFKVDYTSSKPIKSAIAYYKNKNGSPSDPYIEYNITPIPNSSDIVKLPFIPDQGEYELIIELMDEDGVAVKETSSFKIGNCSGDKPKVSIKWRDNSGTEDRICTTSNCEEYVISANYSDADNNINTVEVFMSQDNGITWSSIISNLSGSTTFGTGALSAIGKRLFKVVVTDLSGNIAESNTLSYSKQSGMSKFYSKTINGISCEGRGDGPTNWDVYCFGREDFSLSNTDLLNIVNGFIRMRTDGGTPEIGLSKSGSGALVLDQVFPVTTLLTVSYGAVGYGTYPSNGYPSNVIPAVYRFEYSANGTTDWTPFDFSIDD
ncbi:hypothetical protein [uncultured Chryseobacterium sp.]|uniref:hypothetical protein n=1 Tax=uncultured Chryseobacterium sp. TaxID=259322 RepID=UPI0037478E43